MSAFVHNANAFLFAHVQLANPGYRKISYNGTVSTLVNTDSGATGLIWPDFVALIGSSVAQWDSEILSTGAVRIHWTGGGVPAGPIAWPDRLGQLIGMEVQPGDSSGTVTEVVSKVVPWGGIPLYGASWERVDLERSVRYHSDRLGRERGYVYGGARLWTWSLVMSNYALDALRVGWCLRTKIAISGAGSSGAITGDISASQVGRQTGWPLGIKSVTWQDKAQTIARVELLVAGGAV